MAFNIAAAELALATAQALLLRGHAAAAIGPLQAACEHAACAGLAAHARQLQVLLAEAFIAAGEPGRSLALLREADTSLHDGHEWACASAAYSNCSRRWPRQTPGSRRSNRAHARAGSSSTASTTSYARSRASCACASNSSTSIATARAPAAAFRRGQAR